MSTETFHITVSDLSVEVVRKSIKNLHLGVYPPDGRVRVATPLAVSDDAIRLAIIGKLGWIHRQQEKFQTQPRQSQREMVNGESHYFQGQRYRIRLVEQDGTGKVILRPRGYLEIQMRTGSSVEQREQLLQRWYRDQLKSLIPPLLEKWQPTLGVKVADWGIKQMKTKWGSCNIADRRIWLNLELAKKPLRCLEYVVVHELIHLLERNHNDRFTAYLDRFLPHWRLYRAELNELPLRDEVWDS